MMSENSGVKRKRRGPYRSYVWDKDSMMPRSTAYERRRALREIIGFSQEIETLHKPLYPDARITLKESLVLCMNLGQKHPTLNKEVLASVINLIKAHMPKKVSVPHLDSMYKFVSVKQSCFPQGSLIKHIHHVCPKCFYLYTDDEDKCPTSTTTSSGTIITCGTARYKKDTTKEPEAGFIEVDVEKQIQNFFTDPTFVQDLKYRFLQPKDDHIRDVYDGSEYTRHAAFFSDPYNISLLWHTDGVEVFKNNTQLWPLTAVINELPPWKRFSKRNFLLMGLYFGKHKPDMNVYLTPFVMSLNKLYVQGIDVTLHDGSMSTCRVKALAATMDLPAMSAVKVVHQWSGSFGCGTCEMEGQSVVVGNGRCRAYLKQLEAPRMRTSETIQAQAIAAITQGRPVVGVKGMSTVMMLKDINFATHFTVDYMHGTCLGTVSKLLHTWVKYKNTPYSIKNSTHIIDARLHQIAPPTAMRRYPLKLSDLRNTKASQYRDFLLFYGVHVLQGIMPQKYLEHFGLLARGIYLLCQSDITKQEVKEASEKLDNFYSQMEKLYGSEHCTLNVHNIGSHLVDYVKMVGPLFTHSAFFFESLCGDFARMVNGTRFVLNQIIEGVQNMHQFRLAVSDEDDLSRDIKATINNRKKKYLTMEHGFTSSSWNVCKEDELLAAAKTENQVQITNRADRCGETFEGIGSSKKRNCDAHISYAFNGQILFGTLKCFLKYDNAYRAIIYPFALNTSQEQLLPHMKPVKSQRNIFHMIQLDEILRKLVLMPGEDDKSHIIELPSTFEHN